MPSKSQTESNRVLQNKTIPSMQAGYMSGRVSYHRLPPYFQPAKGRPAHLDRRFNTCSVSPINRKAGRGVSPLYQPDTSPGRGVSPLNRPEHPIGHGRCIPSPVHPPPLSLPAISKEAGESLSPTNPNLTKSPSQVVSLVASLAAVRLVSPETDAKKKDLAYRLPKEEDEKEEDCFVIPLPPPSRKRRRVRSKLDKLKTDHEIETGLVTAFSKLSFQDISPAPSSDRVLSGHQDEQQESRKEQLTKQMSRRKRKLELSRQELQDVIGKKLKELRQEVEEREVKRRRK